MLVGNWNRTRFMERTLELQKIVNEREIKTLIHFTRVRHLNNILRNGLLIREELERNLAVEHQDESPIFNDQLRLDGLKNATSLSISFPNYSMFYRCRKEAGSAVRWVLLAIDPRVLWELDCAFCNDNAASNAVRFTPLEERKTADAFIHMFEDFDDGIEVIERASQILPDKYPTHPQAEVLVFERIPPEYIKSVGFQSDPAMRDWQSQQHSDIDVRCIVATAYYNQRAYSLSNKLID